MYIVSHLKNTKLNKLNVCYYYNSNSIIFKNLKFFIEFVFNALKHQLIFFFLQKPKKVSYADEKDQR